jgi:hypothetical protein
MRAQRCACQDRRNDSLLTAIRGEKFRALRKCRKNAGFCNYRRFDFAATASASIVRSAARAHGARCARGEIHRAKKFCRSRRKIRVDTLSARKNARIGA